MKSSIIHVLRNLAVFVLASCLVLTVGFFVSAHAEIPAEVQSGSDLDVIYIQRLPEDTYFYLVNYDETTISYDNKAEYVVYNPHLTPEVAAQKRWPNLNETVTYIAHVRNKGMVPVSQFNYTWYVDGVEVPSASGSYSGYLEYDQEVAFSMPWQWQDGPHTVTFAADSDNAIPEISEQNSTLTIRTDAYSYLIRASRNVHTIFMQYKNKFGSYSFEDWMQHHFLTMNTWLDESNYEVCPQGSKINVRIDRIVVYDGTDTTEYANRYNWDGGWTMDETVDGRLGPKPTLDTVGEAYIRYYIETYLHNISHVDRGLIHELGHQIGLIDYYQMNLYLGEGFYAIKVPDAKIPDDSYRGKPFSCQDLQGGCGRVTGDTVMSALRWPGNVYTIHEFGMHEVASLNRDYGYFDTYSGVQRNLPKRRGYFGDSQFDIPTDNRILLLDTSGNPVQGARIRVYQHFAGFGFPNVVKFDGYTDSQGYWTFPHEVTDEFKTAPWGTGMTNAATPFAFNFTDMPNVIGRMNSLFLIIDRAEGRCYRWMDIGDFNFEYWRGHTTMGTYTFTVTFLPIVPTVAPRAPTQLAVAVKNSNIELTWEDNSGMEDGFAVLRSSDASAFSEIASLPFNALSYTDTAVRPNIAYSYKVGAYNIVGTSESGTASASIALTAPSAPTGASAKVTAAFTITVSWQDTSSNEDGFIVLRRKDGEEFAELARVGVDTTSYVDKDVRANTKYYYKIQSYNDAGVASSNESSITTSNWLKAPANVSVAATASRTLTISWEDVNDNEVGYYVTRSTNGTTYSVVASLPFDQTSYTDTNLNKDTLYYYRIRVYNTYTLAISAIANAKTLANFDPTLGVLLPDSGSSKTGETASMTASYFDQDGWQEISEAHIHVGSEVLAYYRPGDNMLHLEASTPAEAMLGAKNPDGTDLYLENSYVKLNCTTTTVSASGNSLTLYGKFIFKDTLLGTHDVVLGVKDAGSLISAKKGTWTVIRSDASPQIASVVSDKNPMDANSWVTFTTVVSDDDGVDDIQAVRLLAATQVTPDAMAKGLLAKCEKVSGAYVFSFSSDAGATWTACPAVLNNAYVTFDCAGSRAVAAGTTLTITWRALLKESMVYENGTGLFNVFVAVADAHEPVYEFVDKGDQVIVANALPKAVSAVSSNNSLTANQWATFTTTVSDADGAIDLATARLLVATGTSADNKKKGLLTQCVRSGARYNFYLSSDAGATWKPCTSSLENNYVKFDCVNSRVVANGNTLAVSWRALFKDKIVDDNMTQLFNVYAEGIDEHKATTGLVDLADQTIKPATNKKPTLVSLVPASSQVVVGTPTVFTTQYADVNGWQNLKYVYIRMNTSYGKQVVAYYNENTNLLYLANETGLFTTLAGVAPGSKNADGSNRYLENSIVKLNCTETTVKGSDVTLGVNWMLTFKSTFTGNKNIQMRACDESNACDGYSTKGSVKVQ